MSSENLKQLVQKYVEEESKDGKDAAIASIVEVIGNSLSSLLALVMVLGGLLTSSTSSGERQKAMLIIYETLLKCNDLHLNLPGLNSIITFLLSRFEHDFQCQPHIILTLCVLYNQYHEQLSQKDYNEDGETTTLLARCIGTVLNKLDFEQIKLKIRNKNKSVLNYNQMSRERCLKMMDHAISNYTDIVTKQLDPNNPDLFISGCIRLIDGESDPRNILLSFRLYQSLFRHHSSDTLSQHIQVETIFYSLLIPRSKSLHHFPRTIQCINSLIVSIFLFCVPTQELFEIMEVYFPIEFNAPKADKDAFGITKQQLTEGLNASFVCDPLLSSFVLPMLFEKLDDDEVASNKEHMMDTIATLNHCCNTFGLKICKSYLRDIYDKTKSIVLYGSEPEVTDAALDLIQSLVDLICAQNVDNVGYYDAERSNDGNTNGSVIDNVNTIGWTSFMEAFISDFKSEIKIPDAKLARLSSKIIIQIANSNIKAFELVMKYLWNDIITKYNETKENIALISQQRALFELMTCIFMGLQSMEDIDQSTMDIVSYCTVFMDEFKGGINGGDLNAKCLSMITLSYLAQSTLLLKESYIGEIVAVIYKQFESEFISDRDPDDDTKMEDSNRPMHSNGDSNSRESLQSASSGMNQYKEIIYNALSRIASIHPHIVVSKFVLPLTSQCKLDRHQRKMTIDTTSKSLHRFVESVAPLCLQNAYIWHHVIRIILTPLSNVSKRMQNKENLSNFLKIAIYSCIYNIDIILDFNKIERAKMDTVDENENGNLIDEFLTGFIINFNESVGNYTDYDLIIVIGRVISRLIAGASTEIQIKYTKYSIESINMMMEETDTMPNPYRLLIQLMAIASSNTFIDDDSLLQFISNLQSHLLSHEVSRNVSGKMMDHYFECIGCILNKSNASSIITPFINSDAFDDAVKSIKIKDIERNNANPTLSLTFVIWVIKALSVRCYRDKTNQKMKYLIEFLCKCLLSTNQDVGRVSASGFDIIMKDSDLILSKKNHCKISNLYKQRVFNQAIKYIMDELWNTENADDSDSKLYLLLAVGNLMRNVPHSILTSHLSNLLPLMIQAFESPMDTLRISILNLLEVLLENNLQCIVPHVKRTVPILLELTKYKKSAKVRISALKCLLLLSGLEYQVTHNLTHNVLRSLQSVLSDRKKKVREIAVQCRNQWYLVGET